MTWTFTDDIGIYQQAAGDLLSARPVHYTVFLTVLANLRQHGREAFGSEVPVLGWWSDGTGPAAAVLVTPPYPMLLTALPGSSASELATALAGRAPALAAVNGAEPDARAFASAWSRVTGRQSEVRQRQRLYRLGDLSVPDPWPPGQARVATGDDATIAEAWFGEFAAETGERGPTDRLVQDRLSDGRLLLWEADGEPVSMAGVNALAWGVARIGPVYTPSGQRRRGYAGAVTATLSAHCLEQGAQSVILFTDLANPASNSVYVRLGFQPIEDRVVLNFTN